MDRRGKDPPDTGTTPRPNLFPLFPPFSLLLPTFFPGLFLGLFLGLDISFLASPLPLPLPLPSSFPLPPLPPPKLTNRRPALSL